jgi:magnesium transporter
MLARVFENDEIKTITSDAEIRAAIDAKLPIWIELERKCAEGERLMLEVFDIHPLTIEDIYQTRTAPKLEDYRKYLYVIVHGIKSAKRGTIEMVELDVVIGKTFVITHDPHGEITKDLVDELMRDPALLCKGPAWLAHAILDNAVDRYLPIIDHLNEDIEKLETDALVRAGTQKGPAVLKRILKFRRMLQELRRMGIHQREIFLRLSRGDFEEIPRDVVPFFRDVHDHFVRITDLLEGFRDAVTSALEAYLTVQNNRMGEVMKTLTLWSTVFLPLTFIAGVYGMNFDYMPEVKWIGGYPVVLVVMLAVAIGIVLWFRRRGWVGNKDELPEDLRASKIGKPEQSPPHSKTG